MLRLALLLVLAGLLTAAAATAATPAQYRTAMNATCRSYTPVLQKEKRSLKTVAGVQRLAQLAVSEDQKLLARPVPAQLANAMRPVLVQLRVFHAQALAALKEAKAKHEPGAFRYLLRMQSEEAALDKAFNAVGLRACGSEQ